MTFFKTHLAMLSIVFSAQPHLQNKGIMIKFFIHLKDLLEATQAVPSAPVRTLRMLS